MKKLTYLIVIGLAIISCSCGNSKEVASTSTKDTTENQQKETPTKTGNTAVGIPSKTTTDFYAHSDDGRWNMSIRFGQTIVFNSPSNHIMFQAPTNKKIVAAGANVVSIFAQNDQYILKATIDVVDCAKDNGRKVVSVMIRNIKTKKEMDFSGCGKYMGDPDLQDVWYVEKVNDQQLTASEFPHELPHFEFDLLQQKIEGFAGCNQVHGNLSFDYNKITIKPLVSTRMYCGEASKIETQIMEILNGQPIYKFQDGKLYIETTKGSMILKKVNP